ncbi:MAG: hypothetical protein QOE76_526 [Frankiales bacterium]|nr:hypothetical protein [Frankiales bacterium]
MATRTRRWRAGVIAALAAVVAGSGVGMTIASAKTSAAQRGVDGYGMTKAFYNGHSRDFTYNLGYFCDKSVSSTSTTGCEAGSRYVHAPSPQHSPLYITVPLGFPISQGALDCPNALTCIDHPGTIDLTRVEPALKALFPQLTDTQLTAALRNIDVPGHDHFIGTLAKGKPQWWEVRVVVVDDAATYRTLQAKKSLPYLQSLLNRHDKYVIGTVPTNLFLYFAVQ